MKRITIIGIMCLTTCLAWAVEVEVNGIMYNVDIEAKTAKVVHKESKYEGSIVIPSSILVDDVKCSVTSIGEYAFFSCSNLISVMIPENVTSIEKDAFACCFGLSSVTFPSTLIRIGDDSFNSCSSLTTITIPSSVTSIGYRAFHDCYHLASLVIPEGVTDISHSAFSGCSGLTSVTIPSSVTNLEYGTFRDCNGLTDVYCYAVTAQAATYAFEQCPIGSSTLHVPASAFEDYKSTEPWSQFGTIVALDTPSTPYHPFVERGKYWYVHRFNAITDEHDAVYYTFPADKNLISIDGHEYLPMTVRKAAGREYLEGDREEGETTVGLFREENEKVYFRQSADETEQLVYDFSLNVGDVFMFPPESADEAKMEVTAVGQTVLADDTLKTISFNTAGEPTWIEGIGYTSSPLAFMTLPPNGDYYVTAYVGGTNYLPLTFSEPYLGWWGTDLTRGKRLDKDVNLEDDTDSLAYELVPDPRHNGELNLHVSGRMWTHSGPHNYIYCVAEPTDGVEDADTKQIRLIKEPLNDTAEIGLYQVDLSFPRFPKDNYIAVDNRGEHQVTISEGVDYRPFIEEGKVWKVGWFGSTEEDSLVLMREEKHYFDGDTIVGDRLCKKMITKTIIAGDDPAQETHHAVYEDDRHVYTATSDGTFKPLYDFASEKATLPDSYFEGEGTGTIQSKLYIQDEKFHGWITYITGFHSIMNPDYDVIRWMEGVGCQGFYNSFQMKETGAQRRLISCTVGDEVLYYDSLLVIVETPECPTGSDVKKQWLDFTHVVKPRPKAPERTRGAAVAADAGDEVETLKGEYSAEKLFVNFKPLAGPYVVTITDAAGSEVYRKEVQTNNVVGLNTDISAYSKGNYTISVENSAEAFTASFVVKDETAVTSLSPDPSRKGGGQAGAVYDLSGRRVAASSLPRGIYIKDGRKVVR